MPMRTPAAARPGSKPTSTARWTVNTPHFLTDWRTPKPVKHIGSVQPRRLPVHLAPVAHLHHQHAQGAVFNPADDAVVADPVLPEFTQPGAFQGFADAARICQRGPTRSCRKTRIRRAACGSSLSRSLTAARSISIVQAITLHHAGQRDRVPVSAGDSVFG